MSKVTEVRALLNHDWNHEIGKTGVNVELKEDVIGLKVRAEFTDPEVVADAKAGRLRGWSFSMRDVVEHRAERENGLPLRTITDFVMDEISLINHKMKPWYESTTATIEARAEGETAFDVELRAEEFEADYIGFEDKNEPEKVDNSQLKALIEKYGGNV